MSPAAVRARKNAARPDRPLAAPDPEWREVTLRQLRTLIHLADPLAVEEVKWRKPSNPDGVPVWSHDGILCIGNTLKLAVRLTFPKGAQVKDPKKLFNTRLDSKTVRAIDFREGERIDERALRTLVRSAATLNTAVARSRRRSS